MRIFNIQIYKKPCLIFDFIIRMTILSIISLILYWIKLPLLFTAFIFLPTLYFTMMTFSTKDSF